MTVNFLKKRIFGLVLLQHYAWHVGEMLRSVWNKIQVFTKVMFRSSIISSNFTFQKKLSTFGNGTSSYIRRYIHVIPDFVAGKKCLPFFYFRLLAVCLRDKFMKWEWWEASNTWRRRSTLFFVSSQKQPLLPLVIKAVVSWVSWTLSSAFFCLFFCFSRIVLFFP